MTHPATSPRSPILVGELVVIVRPAPGVPVNHEGRVGKVIDHAVVGRAFLVQLDGAFEPKWFEAEVVARFTEPPPERELSHDGIDEHLDAIEREVARRTQVGLDALAPRRRTLVAGHVTVGRAAFVPKGGA